MSNSNLEALFANLRPRSRDPSDSQSPAAAAFGLRSPPPAWSVNPAHMPNSPPPNPQSSSGRVDAQSLLNLLNYGTSSTNNQSSGPSAASQPARSQPSGGATNASDLLAMLQKGSAKAAPVPSTSGQDSTVRGSENGDSQALLTFLQNRQSPQAPRETSAEPVNPPASVNDESTTQQATIATVNPSAEKKDTIFTYSNPFEALQQSRKSTPVAAPAQPKASPSPIFTTPTIERGASPSEFPRRKMLTPRSASAKAERLARENSIKSNGTPEPTVTEQSLAREQEQLPVRPGRYNPYSQPAEEEVKEGLAVAVEEAQPATAQEQAAVASEEVGWEDPKTSPAPPGDEWEDAEESPSSQEERPKVPVYNFPIRPFISLSLELTQASQIQIREDGVMEISRLKKEFDQLDRCLAAATTKYIAYALVKNGGMRIIRQDDGSDRQVFKNSGDRIFNISFCTTANNAPPLEHQAILGTGVSGTVYYATVSKEGNDLFEKNELDSEVLCFPPWPPADENSAGGVLKTRAKRSSRHPEYFAVGRGKSIHIIWPATAMFAKYGISEGNRQVDMESLYQDRNLQIATGKAGKDFSFSEDDSLIVSLDKTGRLRFWDIRSLTDDANATAGKVAPVKVDTPLLSLLTASPTEKSWPTSVILIDKARPYSKGGAQRYVLVGLRQNHTLQLWDIALGKAVQELNFPHENETDGVCSVNYHPASGFIVVGHPTRNSIFFIHLSAPRYAVSSSTDQATYVSMIASKDPEGPKPDSTACMSGVREISFASKGELRSVELLSIHKASKTSDKSPQDALFELYVVHSKGVTCLTITKEDLGLDANSKVIEGIDAVKAGIVSTRELKLGSVIEESSSRTKSPPEEPSSSTGKTAKKKAKKAQQAVETQSTDVVVDASAEQTKSIPTPEPIVATNGVQKPEVAVDDMPPPPKESKKSKKKATVADALNQVATSRSASPAKLDLQASTAKLDAQAAPPQIKNPAAPTATAHGLEIPPLTNTVLVGAVSENIEKLGQAVSKEFKKELQSLYKDIQTDRIAQDSTASARQESVLRLVSQTLTSNVEKTMASIVAAQIQQVVVPAITAITSQAVQDNVGSAIAKSLQDTVPQKLGEHIPAAVQTALTGTKFAQSIQESISQKLSKSLEIQVVEIINRNVGGAVGAAAEKAASAVEARMVPLFQKLEDDRRNDRDRLEKFNTAIAGMVDTLKSMSETQVAFQHQILLDRQNLGSLSGAVLSDPRQVSTAKVTASPAPLVQPRPIKPKSAQELEQDEISAMMSEGRYEDASIKWLHSKYQAELFDKLFVGFTPEYLATDVSALVAFSVAVTVTKAMETNIESRLEWINAAMDAVDWRDAEIAELSHQAPQLLDSLVSKVENLYMTLAEENISNPVIKMIPPIAKKARDLRAALRLAEAERR